VPSRGWIRDRRTAYLAERKARGAERPLPVKVGEANCQGVTEGVDRVRANIRRASVHADLIFFSEVANVRVSLALGDGWHVHQGGDTEGNSDKAGCAIALRKTRGKLVERDLVFGVKGGLGIRDRYIPHALAVFDQPDRQHAWAAKVAAYHAPPMRAWAKWPTYMRNLLKLRPDVAGGDGNKLQAAVSGALRRKVRGHHVTQVAVRYWIPSTKVRAFDIGSDHHMSVTTLWPNP
jgi:hypothetical protein